MLSSKQKQIWCDFTNRSRYLYYTIIDLPYSFNYMVAALVDEGIGLISQKKFDQEERAFDGGCILGFFSSSMKSFHTDLAL